MLDVNMNIIKFQLVAFCFNCCLDVRQVAVITELGVNVLYFTSWHNLENCQFWCISAERLWNTTLPKDAPNVNKERKCVTALGFLTSQKYSDGT